MPQYLDKGEEGRIRELLDELADKWDFLAIRRNHTSQVSIWIGCGTEF